MTTPNDKLSPSADRFGRLLIAAIFVSAGAGKTGGYAATRADA